MRATEATENASIEFQSTDYNLEALYVTVQNTVIFCCLFSSVFFGCCFTFFDCVKNTAAKFEMCVCSPLYFTRKFKLIQLLFECIDLKSESICMFCCHWFYLQLICERIYKFLSKRFANFVFWSISDCFVDIILILFFDFFFCFFFLSDPFSIV